MNNIELYNDHFQNYKTYQIPKAQLVINCLRFGKEGERLTSFVEPRYSNGKCENLIEL